MEILSKNKNQEVRVSYNTNFEKFNVSKSLVFLGRFTSIISVLVTIIYQNLFDIFSLSKIGNIETKKPLISLDEVSERKIRFYGEEFGDGR